MNVETKTLNKEPFKSLKTLPENPLAYELRRWGAGLEAGDGGKRWPWRPRWREPPLLAAPISPHCRSDDMRMSLTIGAHHAICHAWSQWAQWKQGSGV